MKHQAKYVYKKWGYEKWIENNEKYCGKILRIHKQYKTSFHEHKIKSETLYLQEGLVLVKIKEPIDPSKTTLPPSKFVLLRPGDCLNIPVGTRHSIIALEDSSIFEVSTQHIESDSIRFFDESRKLIDCEFERYKDILGKLYESGVYEETIEIF